ncbi:MAG: hypothetical protein AAGC81_13030 [Pseudomonadota bacterium]
MIGIASFLNNPTRLTHSSDFSELLEDEAPDHAQVTGDVQTLMLDSDNEAPKALTVTETDKLRLAPLKDRAA